MNSNLNPYTTVLTLGRTFEYIRDNGHGNLVLNYNLFADIGDKLCLKYYANVKSNMKCRRMTVEIIDQYELPNEPELGKTMYCYIVETVLDQFTKFESY